MIYNNELNGHKRSTFRHPKGLLTFQTSFIRQRKLSTIDRIVQELRQLTMSIHGASYIWEKDFHFKARLFWCVVVLAAIVSSCIMYMLLLWQYDNHQIKTVVATSQMPIYKINFPAVALCPWGDVNWLRYKAAEEKFLPDNSDSYTKNVFYNLLQIMDNMELSKLDSLALLQNHTVPPIINQISLNDLADFMAFRCDDFFVECAYDETKYDCCKIFVSERTEKGVCMVFNSMVSEESRKKQITDKFYPWKNRKSGEGTGLKFTIRYNKAFAKNKRTRRLSIDVMIKVCEQWSHPVTHIFSADTISHLAITPVVSETSENTKHFDPRRRGCLFANEKSKHYDRIEGLKFNKFNCVVKCQQKNLIKICNCSLAWFFPQIDTRECTVADFKCIYDNKDIFTYIKSPLQDKYILDTRRGVVCDCVESCYNVNFLTYLNANKLPNPNASFQTIVGDIYIGQSVITKYETRMRSTVFDLIGQFGGIIALCLGASVLGMTEVVYGLLKIFVLLLLTTCSRKLKVQADPKGKSNGK